MKTKITLVLALFFAFQLSLLIAQTPHLLSHTSGMNVLCTANEGDFLWIGTEGGLVKMNKSTNAMQFYNVHNSPLPDNRIICISIDAAGNRWLGTPAGLMNFTGDEWQAHDLSWAGISNQYIYGIATDTAGTLWIGTKTGLLEYSNFFGTLHTSALMNLQANYISGIVVDTNNVKWISCNSGPFDIGGNGLLRFDSENWSSFTSANSAIRSNYISCLALGANGKLWMGHPANVGQYNTPAAGGISSFDGNNWQSFHEQNTPMLNKNILSIACSANGTVWAGTGQGICTFDGDSWTLRQAPLSLSPSSAFSWIGTDAANTLWLGEGLGGASGLLKLSGQNWSAIQPTSSGLKANRVNCMNIDANNTKWIGAPFLGELLSLSSGNWQSMNLYDLGVAYGQVNSIAFNNAGRMWLSVDDKLISKDANNWTTHLSYLTTLGDIVVDAQNVVWIAVYDQPNLGVYGGLIRYDGQSTQIFNDDNTAMPGRRIKHVATSSTGDVWVSVRNYAGLALGLSRYSGQNWTNFDTGNSTLPSNEINCLAMDAQNVLWVGTPNGLVRRIGNTWSVFTTANSGLPANDISAIALDPQNRLWVSASYYNVQFEKKVSILARLDGSAWTVFNDVIPRGRSCDIIRIDSFGNKWLASSEDALGIIDFHEMPVSNDDHLQTTPDPFMLSSYPNPFRHSTGISFSLEKAGTVELTIYNSKGQKVKSLCQTTLPMGSQRIEWDGTDDKGQKAGQGLYLYRLKTNGVISTRKLIKLN